MHLSRPHSFLVLFALALNGLLLACSGSGSIGGADSPPGSPTRVVATADIRAARVTWSRPAETGGVFASLTYVVTAEPGGASVTVTDRTEARVEGLSNGTRYQFTVTARNSVGEGPPSEPSTPVTTPDVPRAPEALVATSGVRRVSFRWSPSSSDGGRPLSGYRVEASPSGRSASTSGTSVDVDQLSDGTSYSFVVIAMNAVGESPPSEPVQASTFSVASAPTEVAVVPGTHSAVVSWRAPANDGGAPVTQYRVTASPGGATATSTGLSARVSGLDNDTQYTFTVRAVNAVGDGPSSEPVEARTFSVASAPTDVTGVPGNASVEVSWRAPAHNGGAPVTHYQVTASPGGAYATSSGLSAKVWGLTNGTSYTFTVHAVNAVGAGPASEPSPLLTPRTVPSAPRTVTAQGGLRMATVSWSPPTSTGGAPIQEYRVNALPSGPSVTTPASETSVTVSGLESGKTYTFAVFARNEAGFGPAGNSNAITTVPTPSTPSNVKAEAEDGAAVVYWNPSSVPEGWPLSGYRVTASPGGATRFVPLGSLSARMEPLVNGTAYTFTVRATNAAGDSLESDPTPPVVPSATLACLPRLPGWPLLPTGSRPRAVASADFDADGRVDLAVANHYSHNLTVLFNQGAGRFTRATFGPFHEPTGVVATDLDGDGKPDLAVSSWQDGVWVLKNSGGRSFGAPSAYPASLPIALAAGDLDSDGRVDLVMSEYGSGNVGVLLNRGTGTFGPVQQFLAGSYPRELALGDFDGKQGLDVAVVTEGSNEVRVLFNQGAGLLGPAVPYTVGYGPLSVVAADLDGEGSLDLAVANTNAGTLSVLKNDGTGTFAAAALYVAGLAPASVRAGDFNEDGAMDLVVASHTAHALELFINRGGGTFQAAPRQPSAPHPLTLALADFDGDKHLDVAVAAEGAGGTEVLRGRGDGTLLAPTRYETAPKPLALAVGLFNGDLLPDLISAGSEGTQLQLHLNAGGGKLSAPLVLSTGHTPLGLATGDLNGDGRTDLTVVSAAANAVEVSLGTGDGGFASRMLYATGQLPHAVAIGQVGGSPAPDLVVANYQSSTVGVLINRGDGTFQPQVTYAVAANPRALALEDLDGDGYLDVAVAHQSYAGVLTVLWGAANGTLGSPLVLPTGRDSVSVTAARLDGDALPELVVVNLNSDDLNLFVNQGGRGFQAATRSLLPGSAPYSVLAADFTGDGVLDLATADVGRHSLTLLRNRGDATFDPVHVAAGAGPTGLVAADLDANGTTDLAAAHYYSSELRVFLNAGCF